MSDVKVGEKKIENFSIKHNRDTRRGRRGVRGAKRKTIPKAPPIYSFNGVDFFEMYCSSSDFREIVKSGKYIYLGGRIVLKSKSCLVLKDNKLELAIPQGVPLSDYCAGVRKSTVVSVGVDTSGTRVRGGRTSKQDIIRFIRAAKPRPHRGVAQHFPFKESFIPAGKITSLNDITNDNLYLFFGGGQEPPYNFSEALVYFMKKKNVTVEQLAEKTGVSEKTIQRMRRNPEGNYKLEAVIAICIALQLDPYYSDMMLDLAGHKLKHTERDTLYRLCIHYAYEQTVESCNNRLIELGQKPLTNLHD